VRGGEWSWRWYQEEVKNSIPDGHPYAISVIPINN